MMPYPNVSDSRFPQAEQFEQRARRQCSGINCVMVSRRDELVYSHCFNPSIQLETPTEVYSVTKSVTSLAVGIAIEKNLLPGIGCNLSDLLATTEYAQELQQFTEQSNQHSASRLRGETSVADLTLHHLLTMTAGTHWPNQNYGFEPLLGRVMRSDNWIRQLLLMPTEPSLAGQFNYNTGLSHLLSCVVTAAVGEPLDQFLERELFQPLGITAFQWPRDPQGFSCGGWGLHLSVDALHTLGQLCVHNGCWEDRQLVSQDWLQQSFKAHTPNYGYHWWLGNWAGQDYALARGLGGQLLYVLPASKAVIAVTVTRQKRNMPIEALVEEYLLPLVCEG